MAGQGQGRPSGPSLGRRTSASIACGAGSRGSLSPAGAAAKTHGPHTRKKNAREYVSFSFPGSIIHKTTRPCAATLHPEVSHVECNAERGRWLEPPPRAQNGGRPGRRCNLIAQPASRTKRRPRNRPAPAARQAAGVDHPNRHLSGHVLAPDSRSPPGRHEGLRIRVRASLLLGEQICQAAAARGIEIASVQGTFNMSHPDAEHRRAGLRRLRVLAAACQRLGTSKIHICTGTRDRENMWRRHPDNDSPEAGATWWPASARRSRSPGRPRHPGLRAGGQQRCRFGEEGPAADGRDRLAAPEGHDGRGQPVPRRRVAAHERDPGRGFALLGKDIVMAHAKDLSHDGDAGHEPAGHGKLDYDRYLSLLHAYGFKGPLLLHGLTRGAGARLRGLSPRENGPRGREAELVAARLLPPSHGGHPVAAWSVGTPEWPLGGRSRTVAHRRKGRGASAQRVPTRSVGTRKSRAWERQRY